MNKKVIITPQTRELFNSLITRGIKAELEYSDGHKHVDIAILDARIYIEVDGLQHFTNPDEIERDFKRNHYSDGDDFDTFHISNFVLEHHLEKIADAIAVLVKRRANG